MKPVIFDPRCAHQHGLFQKIFHQSFVRRPNFDLIKPPPCVIMDPIAKFGITIKGKHMKLLKSMWDALVHYSEEVYNFRQRYHKTISTDRYL